MATQLHDTVSSSVLFLSNTEARNDIGVLYINYCNFFFFIPVVNCYMRLEIENPHRIATVSSFFFLPHVLESAYRLRFHQEPFLVSSAYDGADFCRLHHSLPKALLAS